MDLFNMAAQRQQIEEGDAWERIIEANDEITERLRVPGGWIYRSWIDANNDSMAMVFVPEPNGDRLDGIGNQLQRIANALEHP